MTQDIGFSVHPTALDTHVEQLSLPWSEFAGMVFTDIPIQPNKIEVSAFVPALWGQSGQRKDSNVQALTCLVIDIDEDLDSKKLDALRAKLKAGKHQYALHYTYGCHTLYKTRGYYKVRAVMPLSEPIPVSEWPSFWARGVAYFDEWTLDLKCKNTSRLYYAPAAPSKEALDWMLSGEWVSLNVESPPLDVGVIRAMPLPVSARTTSKHTPITSTPLATLEDNLRQDLRDLQGRQDQRGLAMALDAVLKGHEYSTEGSRNQTMTQIAFFIASKYPHHDADTLAQVFKRSQDTMACTHATPPDDLDVISNSIRRAQVKILEGRSMMMERHRNREARVMERIAGVADAEYRYSEDDKRAMAEQLNIDVDALSDHWVMATRGAKDIFILTKNGIQEHTYSAETFPAVSLELLPANIKLMVTRGSKSDPRLEPRPFKDLMHQHGTMVDVAYDNRLTQPRMRKGGNLILPCKRSSFVPEFVPHADNYLRALFGEQYQKAEQWLAWFPDTSAGLAALILKGKKNIGKTLLATGLAKIWDYGQPIPFEIATSRFNIDVSKMPLIFSDERLPHEGSVSKHLREFVTSHEFFAERKFGGIYKCLGYRRLIVASNDSQRISDDRHELSMSDLDALKERMWEVDGCTEAQHYLTSLSRMDFTSLRDHGLAEHTLYLAENKKGEHARGRLAVTGSGDVGKHIVLGDRQAQMILQMLTIVMDKAASGKTDGKELLGFRWGNGEIAIANAGVTQNEAWKDVAGPYKPVWSSPGKHLRKVSDGPRTYLLFGGRGMHSFRINSELFYAYLDEHQGVDPDDYKAMVDGEKRGW